MMLAGDYGGANAVANRQAALSRYEPSGPAGAGVARYIPAANVRKTTTRGMITTGPSGKYSRSSGGGGRPSAPPPAAPGPMQTDPNAWLGSDVPYQDQLRQLQLALSNFNADVTRRQGDIGTQYETSNKAMQDQKGIDLKNMEADWAGRGLLRSGLYAGAVGDYNKEFDQRIADLLSGRDRSLAQLLQEQNQFKTQQELDAQAAREQALRRRSESLGI